MFGNLGLHVIKFPSGRFGYVGSIPTDLATIVPADRAAVLGQRAFTNNKGELCMFKFPVFNSEEHARAFAAARGHQVR